MKLFGERGQDAIVVAFIQHFDIPQPGGRRTSFGVSQVPDDASVFITKSQLCYDCIH